MLTKSEERCNVVLADNQESGLDEVVSRCEGLNEITSACIVDVRNADDVERAIARADEIASDTPYPTANILVNSAGITRDGLIANISGRNWNDVIDVNLKGTFLACQKFCDPSRTSRLLQTGGGAIVNIGSIVSSYGNVGQVNYSASKGGVEGLTRSLAKEMAFLSRRVAGESILEAPNNDLSPSTSSIRVSCILPGFIDTPMASAVPDEILDKMRAKTALGRLGQPQDIANLALFLASDRSSFITGETFECSGMLRL